MQCTCTCMYHRRRKLSVGGALPLIERISARCNYFVHTYDSYCHCASVYKYSMNIRCSTVATGGVAHALEPILLRAKQSRVVFSKGGGHVPPVPPQFLRPCTVYAVQRHNIPRDLDGSVVVGAEEGVSKNGRAICNPITSAAQVMCEVIGNWNNTLGGDPQLDIYTCVLIAVLVFLASQ